MTQTYPNLPNRRPPPPTLPRPSLPSPSPPFTHGPHPFQSFTLSPHPSSVVPRVPLSSPTLPNIEADLRLKKRRCMSMESGLVADAVEGWMGEAIDASHLNTETCERDSSSRAGSVCTPW